MVTVDDRGTADRADDLLLAGATYAVAPDNGDGVFQRDLDGPVLFQVSDPSGIAVLRGLPTATYWIIETVAPPGYALANAAPFHPTSPIAGQDCFNAGTLVCIADPTGGGMTAAFFVNTPLPATSTASDYQNPLVIVLAVVGLVIVIGGVASMVLRRD